MRSTSLLVALSAFAFAINNNNVNAQQLVNPIKTDSTIRSDTANLAFGAGEVQFFEPNPPISTFGSVTRIRMQFVELKPSANDVTCPSVQFSIVDINEPSTPYPGFINVRGISVWSATQADKKELLTYCDNCFPRSYRSTCTYIPPAGALSISSPTQMLAWSTDSLRWTYKSGQTLGSSVKYHVTQGRATITPGQATPLIADWGIYQVPVEYIIIPANPTPVISGVSPRFIPLSGVVARPITISGANFGTDTNQVTVSFSGSPCPIVSLSQSDDRLSSTIVCTATTANKLGAQSVTVTLQNSKSATYNLLTPFSICSPDGATCVASPILDGADYSWTKTVSSNSGAVATFFYDFSISQINSANLAGYFLLLYATNYLITKNPAYGYNAHEFNIASSTTSVSTPVLAADNSFITTNGNDAQYPNAAVSTKDATQAFVITCPSGYYFVSAIGGCVPASQAFSIVQGVSNEGGGVAPDITLTAAAGLTFTSVVSASFGVDGSSCTNTGGFTSYVASQCIGRNTCTIHINLNIPNVGDPCPGYGKIAKVALLQGN